VKIQDLDLSGIEDEKARAIIGQLLNLIEELSSELREARVEIQRLRDEVNRLKGEQGKPKIKGNTPKPPTADHSSEQERRTARPRHKRSKKAEIRIDREETLVIDRENLPEDAEFKGYADVMVQDIRLGTDNVLFHKAKYYSAKTRQSYQAELPSGYQGQYGPGIRALCLTLYYGMQASEPKILEFFEHVGIQISEGEISNWLIQDQARFHAEKDALYEAGLASSPVSTDGRHVDAGRWTEPTLPCGLQPGLHGLSYPSEQGPPDGIRRAAQWTAAAVPDECRSIGLPEAPTALVQSGLGCLQGWVAEESLDEASFLKRLDRELPGLGQQHRKLLLDAAAIAAYHAEVGCPVVRVLLCDDAPQFNWLTQQMMQCWVHEGRHYKKLSPVVDLHRQQVQDFLKRFWAYYDQLLAYQKDPSPAEHERLVAEFDMLFGQSTGYAALDQRIAKTRIKKDTLLLVLAHPELPLHNNAAELAVRQRVRKRDVSFGPRTQAGVRAWDTFASLAATTKKLGSVSTTIFRIAFPLPTRSRHWPIWFRKPPKTSIWAGRFRLPDTTPIY
jgi:hypothetical protein